MISECSVTIRTGGWLIHSVDFLRCALWSIVQRFDVFWSIVNAFLWWFCSSQHAKAFVLQLSSAFITGDSPAANRWTVPSPAICL